MKKYPHTYLALIENGGSKKVVRKNPAIITELVHDGYIAKDQYSDDTYQLTSHGARSLAEARQP